jgi:hypothetical protein
MRKARGARRCGDARSGKRHADASLLAPDDVALLTRIAGQHIQRDFVWDARGAGNFERRSHRGYVANRAVDSPAVELDRSGLENTLPPVGSSLLHASGLDRKSEKAANRNIKISWFEEPPVNQGYCHAAFGWAPALWDETSTAN